MPGQREVEGQAGDERHPDLRAEMYAETADVEEHRQSRVLGVAGASAGRVQEERHRGHGEDGDQMRRLRGPTQYPIKNNNVLVKN